MEDYEESGDDFVREAIRPGHAPAERLAGRAFMRWHLPRKHYLRVRQWCHHVRSLITDSKHYYAHRGLSYFTLPGDDLFDVRALEGVCERMGVKVSYLGYNNLPPSGPRTLASDFANHEVRQSDFVDDRSRVLNERFERIATDESTALKVARDAGPFDVINLDFCDSLGNDSGSLDALMRLWEMQGVREEPWLLFVTTRTDRPSMKGQRLDRLLGVVERNLSASERFEEEFAQLGIDVSSLRGEEVTPCDLSRTFSLGLSKWLASLDAERQQVELLDCYWYTVGQGVDPAMVSLAFRVRGFTGLEDAAGLTSTAGAKTAPSEEEQALAMIAPILDVKDPQALLDEDDKLREKVTRQMKEMLERAKYRVDGYEAWVSNENPRQVERDAASP